MYFIASSFSGWSPMRRTGSEEIDSSAPKIHASWLNQILEIDNGAITTASARPARTPSQVAGATVTCPRGPYHA
jgi:hypothetical protein